MCQWQEALGCAEANFTDEHTPHILARVCRSLSVLDSLPPQHLHAVTSINKLTHLSLTTEGSQAFELSAELLSSLTCLVELRHLETSGFICLPTDLSRLSGLTQLRINPSGIEPQDLSDFTQLKFLTIEPLWGRLRTPIHLPKGPSVSLQYLFAGGDCIMYNLEAATHLTQLEVLDVAIRGLPPLPPEPHSWPEHLLHLQKLQLHSLGEEVNRQGASNEELPAEWQLYTSLQQLKIPFFCPGQTRSMPPWFTALKQLTRLDLPGAAMLGFDYCFPYFSKLHHLDLRSYDSQIDHRIFLFSHMPNLTYLSFADLGMDKWNYTGTRDPSDDEVDCLKQLTTMFRQSRKQPANLFRINAKVFSYEWRAKAVCGLPRL